MEQAKVGKFIAECRKNKNMTQAELAEKLNITDRAISKWETGKGMPDSSIMLELCNELDISVNELLSGEVIKMETYNQKAEENLLQMKKQIEKMRKKFSIISYIFGTITILMFIGNIILNSIYRDSWDNSLYRVLGLIISFIACMFWFGASVLKFKDKNE